MSWIIKAEVDLYREMEAARKALENASRVAGLEQMHGEKQIQEIQEQIDRSLENERLAQERYEAAVNAYETEMAMGAETVRGLT